MVTLGIQGINLEAVPSTPISILYLYSDFVHTHYLHSISAALAEKLLSVFHLVYYSSLAGPSLLLFITSNPPLAEGSHLYFKLVNNSLTPLGQEALNFPSEIIQKSKREKICVLGRASGYSSKQPLTSMTIKF